MRDAEMPAFGTFASLRCRAAISIAFGAKRTLTSVGRAIPQVQVASPRARVLVLKLRRRRPHRALYDARKIFVRTDKILRRVGHNSGRQLLFADSETGRRFV
jgi:hypothetical protein